MNNKKLLISIFTVVFIGVTGFIYSLGAVNTPGKEIVFTKDALESKESLMTDQDKTDSQEAKTTDSQEKSPVDHETIYVHICGAIKHPDVYVLKKKSRLIDGVKLAGGFTRHAAKNEINQARELVDGERVYIPTFEEVKSEVKARDSEAVGSDNAKAVETGGKININQAGKDDLMTLPGIGEAKANSMIAYREQNGGFKTIEELKNIEGIKDGVFQKIQSFITVN